MRITSHFTRQSRSQNDIDYHWACVSANLFDGLNKVGKFSGHYFDCAVGETEVFSLADCEGVDLDLLTAAAKNGLLDDEIMVASCMQIEQAYRGKGYGIKLINKAVKEMCGKTFGTQIRVLMHPCPIAWPDKNERDSGRKALAKYYANYFPIKRIGKTNYFYFSVDSLGRVW